MKWNNIAVIEANNKYYLGVDKEGVFAGFLCYDVDPQTNEELARLSDKMNKWRYEFSKGIAARRKQINDCTHAINTIKTKLLCNAYRHFADVLKKNKSLKPIKELGRGDKKKERGRIVRWTNQKLNI